MRGARSLRHGICCACGKGKRVRRAAISETQVARDSQRNGSQQTVDEIRLSVRDGHRRSRIRMGSSD